MSELTLQLAELPAVRSLARELAATATGAETWLPEVVKELWHYPWHTDTFLLHYYAWLEAEHRVRPPAVWDGTEEWAEAMDRAYQWAEAMDRAYQWAEEHSSGC